MLEKETEKLHSLPRVLPVTAEEYLRHKNRPRTLENIEWESWSKLRSDIPTMNEGATPCLIIWEFNSLTGTMDKSGHFGGVSRNSKQKATVERVSLLNKSYRSDDNHIVLPSTEEIHFFGYPDKNLDENGFKEFEFLGEVIQQEVKDNGSAHKHIFLFGQNFGIYTYKQTHVKRNRAIVENALEQYDLTYSIRQWGIPESHIHDYRRADSSGTDNTLYIPENKTLYHLHQRLSH